MQFNSLWVVWTLSHSSLFAFNSPKHTNLDPAFWLSNANVVNKCAWQWCLETDGDGKGTPSKVGTSAHVPHTTAQGRVQRGRMLVSRYHSTWFKEITSMWAWKATIPCCWKKRSLTSSLHATTAVSVSEEALPHEGHTGRREAGHHTASPAS